MTLRLLPAALLAAGLSACGAPSEPAAAPSPAAANGTIATVEALPPGQVRGVLFRAIRDGGAPCPQLTSFDRAGTEGTRPVWSAACSDGSRWRIVLADDGTATVTGAAPR